MKKTVRIAGLAVVLCGLLLCAPPDSLAAIPKGLSVGGQELGGLEPEEARQKIEDYVASMAAQTVTLEVAGYEIQTTAAELGFSWQNPDVVTEVTAGYDEGNVIERYIREKDLEMSPVDAELEFVIDSDVVDDFVNRKCRPLIGGPVDGSITRVDGEFVITPSEDGLVVDMGTTGDRLDRALAQGLTEPVVVEAEVTVSRPEITTEMLATIQDVLGTYTTNYNPGNKSRVTNLSVATEKINGALLMPGEMLSGYECMAPLTAENGYMDGPSIENGRIVDSIGGGVCQVTSTLYNAALFAELDITQRQNHSMVVAYVPPAMDSAIAGTYKDIKFVNPYDTPIYIEGVMENGVLTFTIYGKETRPANRTLKFVSESLGTIELPPVYQTDPSLAPGQQVLVEAGHSGMRARLWKYVYEDGKQVEKKILHTDEYTASAAVYRVGPSETAEVSADPAQETSGGTETGSEEAAANETEAGSEETAADEAGTVPEENTADAPQNEDGEDLAQAESAAGETTGAGVPEETGTGEDTGAGVPPETEGERSAEAAAAETTGGEQDPETTAAAETEAAAAETGPAAAETVSAETEPAAAEMESPAA